MHKRSARLALILGGVIFSVAGSYPALAQAGGQSQSAGTPASNQPSGPAQGVPAPVPQVDPITGRPIDRTNPSGDLIDRNILGRQAGNTGNAPAVPAAPRVEPSVRPVPAYIGLPTAIEQGGGSTRLFDRALLANQLPGETVKERKRPEYAPINHNVGSFDILPYVTAGVGFDSNVYAEANGRADVLFNGTAGVNVRSDWGRNYLGFDGFVRQRTYGRLSSDDVTTGKAELDGVLNLSGQDILTGQVLHQYVALDRSVADEVVNQALPTRYHQTAGEIGSHIERGPIAIDLSARAARTVYSPNFTVIGAPVDQSFRDNNSISGELGISHRLGGQRWVYGQFDAEIRRFDVVAAGLNRDVNVYRAIFGVQGRIARLVRGRLGFGYMRLDFIQASRGSVGTFAMDVDLDWLVSRRTTISLSSARDLRTVSQANALGTILTTINLGVDREVRRNVVVSVALRQQWTDYVNDNRHATSSGGTLSAAWYLDRHLQLRPRLTVLKRTDRGFGIDASPFDVNGGLDLTFRF